MVKPKTKIQPEIEALWDILDRLLKRYKRLMAFAVDDFKEYFEVDNQGLRQRFMNQVFLAWIFTKHELYDGKTLVQLARQVLDLSDRELKVLVSVENAIMGYFEVLGQRPHQVFVRDMFTRKEYTVSVIDLDHKFTVGDVIEARLARRLDGNLFFFGGFMGRADEKKDILHDLKTYS